MSVAPADSASHAPAVHLRPSTPRVSLAGGQLRLLALAGVLFGALGARVHHEEDAAIPAGLRPAALSWLLNHDEFLCDLAVAVPDGDPGDGHPRDSHLTDGGPGDGDGAWSGMRRGSAAVLCDDAPALARRVPGVPPLPGGRVLWAAGAGCRPDRVDSPPAALTLTEAEARLLRGQGVDAVSLLRHPVIAPPPLPDRGHDGGRPRVAVLVDGLHAALLPDAVEAVLAAFTGPAGPPVLDLLPQLPVVLGGRTAGAAHPWQRSRILRRADLVLALGVCPALDLGLAEAAGYGVPGLRLQLRPVDGPQAVPAGLPLPDGKGPVADRLASVLAATLRTCVVDEPAADEPALDEPAHDGFAAPDGSAGRGAGQVVSPPGALRDWLRRVATPAPHSPSGTGTPAESTGPPAPATDPATPPAAHPTDH